MTLCFELFLNSSAYPKQLFDNCAGCSRRFIGQVAKSLSFIFKMIFLGPCLPAGMIYKGKKLGRESRYEFYEIITLNFHSKGVFLDRSFKDFSPWATAVSW